MVYDIPSDSFAIIPLIHSDAEGKPRTPGKGWKVSSSDACVKAEIVDDGGRPALKLTPTAPKGTSHVVYEREDVKDTLDVSIAGAAVTRVAFDVHNAKIHASDETDEPVQAAAVARDPASRGPVEAENDRQTADRASDRVKADMSLDRVGGRVVK